MMYRKIMEWCGVCVELKIFLPKRKSPPWSKQELLRLEELRPSHPLLNHNTTVIVTSHRDVTSGIGDATFLHLLQHSKLNCMIKVLEIVSKAHNHNERECIQRTK
mmetsp:Transcript_99010/g.148317  ORF Transcript_99010/g.148317 Transcript_99010/m.148317 type:complete len:105 (+) Transcript_99010:179-493(+)